MGINALGINSGCQLAAAKLCIETSAQQGIQTSPATQGDTAQTDDTVSLSSLVENAASSNLISRNFAESNPQRSKYITAQLKSFQTQKTFSNKLGSLIDYLSAQFDQSSKYTDAMRLQAKADRLTRQARDAAINEESKNHLDNMRERIAGKAQAAVAGQEDGVEAAPVTDVVAEPSVAAQVDAVTDVPIDTNISIDIVV